MKKILATLFLCSLAIGCSAQTIAPVKTRSVTLFPAVPNVADYLVWRLENNTAGGLTWTWPASNGTSGYVLTTDGAGNLSWAVAPGAGHFVRYDPSSLTTQTITPTTNIAPLILNLQPTNTAFMQIWQTNGVNTDLITNSGSFYSNDTIFALNDLVTAGGVETGGVTSDGFVRFGNGGSGSNLGSLIAATMTATRTWTLPDKDGTVAMLSDITGGHAVLYDPASATPSQVIIPSTDIIPFAIDNGNAGYTSDLTQWLKNSSLVASISNVGKFWSAGNGEFDGGTVQAGVSGTSGILKIFQGVYYGNLTVNPLSGVQTWALPDASGTIALTSDIPLSSTYLRTVPATTAQNTAAPTSTSVVPLTLTTPSGSTSHILNLQNFSGLEAYFANDGSIQTNGDINVSGNATILAGSLTLGTNSDVSAITLYDGTGGVGDIYNGVLGTASPLTNFQAWALPDESGTIALLSDIPSGTGFVKLAPNPGDNIIIETDTTGIPLTIDNPTSSSGHYFDIKNGSNHVLYLDANGPSGVGYMQLHGQFATTGTGINAGIFGGSDIEAAGDLYADSSLYLGGSFLTRLTIDGNTAANTFTLPDASGELVPLDALSIGNAGVVIYNGTKNLSSSGTTAGDVLTSNGTGVAPTWQPTTIPSGTFVKTAPASSSDNIITGFTSIVPLELDVADIHTAIATGLLLKNPTASVAGNRIEYSPMIIAEGSAWQSTDVAAHTWDWSIENEPGNGTTTSYANLSFQWQKDGGGWATGMILRANDDGTVYLSLPNDPVNPNQVATKNYVDNAISGSGSGTVTSVSSGDFPPLFTASVATSTTTPALSFTAVSQSPNLVFAGPTSGSAVAPTFRSLVAADIPSLSSSYVTTLSGGTTGLTPNSATSGAVTLGGTLGIGNGGTGQTTAQNAIDALTAALSSTTGYVLTYNGSHAVFQTPTATYLVPQTVEIDNILNVSTNAMTLTNTSSATGSAANQQQWTPALHLHGAGQKTNTVAASEPTDWTIEGQPTSGTGGPTSSLVISSSVNNGTAVPFLQLIDKTTNGGSSVTQLGATSLAIGNTLTGTNQGGICSIQGQDASGTNQFANGLTITMGRGTGTSNGQAMTFKGAFAGASGTTLNTTANILNLALGPNTIASGLAIITATIGTTGSVKGAFVIAPISIAAANAGITIPSGSVVQITAGTATGAFAITMPTGTEGLHLIIYNNTGFATTGTVIGAGVTEGFVYLGSAWQHIQ